MTFSNPEYLWFMLALALLLALHFLSLKYARRRAIRFANYEAMESFTGEKMLSKNYVTLVLRMLTLLFLVLSISGMVVWYNGSAANSDFVLALDASGSMLAGDYAPDRITAAKEAADLFIDSLPGESRVGVISFAGISFVRQQVTSDLGKVGKAVQAIGVETSGGTAIGDAIVSSSNLLSGSDRPKVVVLLTDGQNNVGITLEEAVAYAKQNGIMIHTIGMGTEKGGSFQNVTFVSKLDADSLNYIANQTGGMFFRADSGQKLKDAYMVIALSTEQLLSFKASSALLLLALLFFFLEWFLTNTRYKTLP